MDHDHGDREPRRTIKSKSNAGSRGRATYRHFVRTTALLRDGSPQCLGMHQRQLRRLHSHNLAWTRVHRSAHSGSHLYISDIMACRLCVVQCVALRVQWNNSLARNKIMIMEYPSSSLRLPAPAAVHVLHLSIHCRLPWWWASRLHDVGSRLPLPRNLSPAFVV